MLGRGSRRASCSQEDCVGKCGKDIQFLELAGRWLGDRPS